MTEPHVVNSAILEPLFETWQEPILNHWFNRSHRMCAPALQDLIREEETQAVGG